MFSPIDEIKSKLDIVEVIGSYLKLQKAGANYRAVCPFHSEKNPSFFVSPARQIWHCFGGCGIGGDMFKFVMQIEGVEFGDALRILAQRAGVVLKKPTQEQVIWRSERARLYEVCELATRFFEKQLAEGVAGKEAKAYLLSRGLTDDSLNKWRLGYSPDTWQGLSDFLASQGYTKDEIEKAGLALSSSKGSFYDRFRGRIIFPVFDQNSQVIGFGGRVFKDRDKKETAKYVNTPNTLLYDKSNLLYGLNYAKVDIRRNDQCVLVEGYMDTIMAHQAGSQNVVATSGTALTAYQLKILKRYTENLVLGFDMDIAGDSATKRGIDLAQAQGFNIKVLLLPEGKDAAELIQKNPKEWEEAFKNQKSIISFYFESAFGKNDAKDPEGKRKISKILLPVLKRIPNQIERSFWVQKLAVDLRVSEADVIDELKKVQSEKTLSFQEQVPAPKAILKSREELLGERLALLCVKFSQKAGLVEAAKLDLLPGKIKEILAGDFSAEKLSPEAKEFFDYISLKADIETIDEKEAEAEIKFCLKEIENLKIKNKLTGIAKELRKAESDKSPQINELSQEFNQVTKTLNNN